MGDLDTWESGRPRAGRLAAPAADLRGRCDLDAGEAVTVERAAGGLVEVCDIRGRPLALVAADAPVDLLDVDPAQARAIRRLTYRLLSVSYVSRVRLTKKLRLDADGDDALLELRRCKLVLQRAKETNRLAELWDAVSEALGAPADNPFVVEGEAASDKASETYAIWRYDGFPHVLCGKVTRLDAERVCVEGYDGFQFRRDDLLALVDSSRGARLKADLGALREAHRASLKAHEAKWRGKVEALVPELGKRDAEVVAGVFLTEAGPSSRTEPTEVSARGLFVGAAPATSFWARLKKSCGLVEEAEAPNNQADEWFGRQVERDCRSAHQAASGLLAAIERLETADEKDARGRPAVERLVLVREEPRVPARGDPRGPAPRAPPPARSDEVLRGAAPRKTHAGLGRVEEAGRSLAPQLRRAPRRERRRAM